MRRKGGIPMPVNESQIDFAEDFAGAEIHRFVVHGYTEAVYSACAPDPAAREDKNKGSHP